MVPKIRIQSCNDKEVNRDGDYVLYWMIANRRTRWNFSLERGLAWAAEFKKPLVVFEALRCGYRWASDRLHRFVLDGMADNAERLAQKNVIYYPYVEPVDEAGKGLLRALGHRACIVVTDDFPSFFLPQMVASAAKQLTVRLEKVDSNGLLPLRAANKVYPTAYSFRRFLQTTLTEHLIEFPAPDPLEAHDSLQVPALPEEILKHWPPVDLNRVTHDSFLQALPIDHGVKTVMVKGGTIAAEKRWQNFLKSRLPDNDEFRNEPEKKTTSGLSPYLHFGHISVHQIFSELVEQQEWNLNRLPDRGDGSRSGWWGMSKSAESFLDELITWRELGYNMCWQRQDYYQFESLPDWAKQTLAEHRNDPRQYVYSLEDFESAQTHDPLWNAAQTQLLSEGRIHNYLRMLWGKKILEWARTPQDALEIMIELNNKYALDGRNPNSYSGIFWTLGRYDRPWGPERPIFGKVRYMSSENTARKFEVKNYVAHYNNSNIKL